MSTSFNPQLLLSVKRELDSSLAAIIRDSQTFFAAPDTSLAALESARSELHRTKGVLQMLNLRGLVAFCGELETLLADRAVAS